MPVATSTSIQGSRFSRRWGWSYHLATKSRQRLRGSWTRWRPRSVLPSSASGLLETLCPRDLVDRVLVEVGREGKRNRLLPPWLVVYALLMMCLSGTVGYGRLMRALATQAVRWRSPAGRSAFGKARMQLGWEVPRRLELRPRPRQAVDPSAQETVEHREPLRPCPCLSPSASSRQPAAGPTRSSSPSTVLPNSPAGTPSSERAPAGVMSSSIPNSRPSCASTAGRVCSAPTSAPNAAGRWRGSGIEARRVWGPSSSRTPADCTPDQRPPQRSASSSRRPSLFHWRWLF